MTVFMVVAFSTLIVAFLYSSTSMFFMVGQANGGDYDMQINALSEEMTYERGNYNFYLDP
jgi:hypothetical protein